MKLIINKAIDIYACILELAKQQTNFKIGYWVSKNEKIFKEPYDFFALKRSEIYKEYLIFDKKGNCMFVDDDGFTCFYLKENTVEYGEKFNKVFNELLNTEVEIEPYLIDITTLFESNITITSEQISLIDCLFTEN